MGSIEIEIHNQYCKLKDPYDRTQAICSILETSQFKLHPGTLSIAFVDDATIKKLHETFLGNPSSTDVITFPGDTSYHLVGEICISVDEAIKNSKTLKTSICHEITLYLIHGWLHLFGFDDNNRDKIKTMRKGELDAMKLVQKDASLPDYLILQ